MFIHALGHQPRCVSLDLFLNDRLAVSLMLVTFSPTLLLIDARVHVTFLDCRGLYFIHAALDKQPQMGIVKRRTTIESLYH